MKNKELQEILDMIIDKDKRILLKIEDKRVNKIYVTHVKNVVVSHNKITLCGEIKDRRK